MRTWGENEELKQDERILLINEVTNEKIYVCLIRLIHETYSGKRWYVRALEPSTYGCLEIWIREPQSDYFQEVHHEMGLPICPPEQVYRLPPD